MKDIKKIKNKITRKNPRKYILQQINNLAGTRLSNFQNGTATLTDKKLLSEALGFRSLCLFSGLSNKDLLMLWDKSNLEYSL